MKQRQLDIYRILLNTEWITADEIAQKLSISNKTVRNYLQNSHDILISFNLQLLRKAGSGYCIIGSYDNRLQFCNHLEDQKEKPIQVPSSERIYYIMYKLLRFHVPLRISQLESTLYISRSSLYTDIDKAKKIAERFQLTLTHEPYKGLQLTGQERNKRTALYYIVGKIHSSSSLIYYNTELQRFIKECFDDDLMNRKIKSFLHTFELKKNVTLAQKDAEYLRLMFIITFDRIRHGYTLPLPDTSDYLLNSFSLIKKIEDSKCIFKSTFHYEADDSEIYYLSSLFLSLKNTNLIFQNTEDLELKSSEIVKRFATYLYDEYPIRNHEEFENSLFYHIYDILKKIRYGYDFSNPYLEQIKSEFKIPYRIALKILPIIKEIVGISFPADEISYIALHIASALEDSLSPLRVIFLYEHRYSELKYSASLIEAHIKEIQIVKKMKFQDYQKNRLQIKHSLLFTTFNYSDSIIPTYQIPPIPDKLYIKNLRDLLNKKFTHQGFNMEI